MIKVKKIFSLLMIFSIILSNVVFAQQVSDQAYYEGRPIDPSREGKDYYREGDVIVYPSEANSEEKRMMGRFARGDISEEEMRKIAKSKFGEGFDEMKFKKNMLESRERIERKDAFSYEHEGYGQRYYVGPSYEGYSKEQVVFSRVFEYIGDDIDPREIKQYCSEPEKIADIVISKFREKVGDIQKVCSQAEEREAMCQGQSKKMCSQIGTPYAREDATELEKLQSIAHSCPVNKDAIVKACILRVRSSIEQSIRQTADSCEKRFEYEGERLLRECSRFKENQICDREKHMERCMGGIKKENFEIKCPEHLVPKCGEGSEAKKRADSNGCAYYYCETSRLSCPPSAAPQCSETQTLQKKTDNQGCVHYFCETANTCPSATPLSCGEGYSLQKRPDERGCASYYCEAIKTCPEPITPACSAGQTLQKKSDDRGCLYYYCEKTPCPEVSKPTCNADEQIHAYYDNAGCTTSYQCIKTCPQLSPPSPDFCANGQIITKYDDKGCVVGYECVNVATTGGVIKITGNAVASTYDDFLKHCENSWRGQEKSCASMLESCDKDALIERCKQHAKKGNEEYASRAEIDCNKHTESEIRAVEDRCSRMDKERERCSLESAKRCEHMEGIAEKCRETLTEENLRKFIIDEAKKRCKFKDIVAEEEDVRSSDKVEIVLAVLNTATEDDISKLELFIEGLEEDLKLQETTVYKGMINPSNFGDIKLLPFVVNAKLSAVRSSERAKETKAKIVAGQKAEEAASKLASLRDSDVPSEYLYIIEDKASEVLDVSDKLEEIEQKDGQKGIGYKIKLFLGLAKAAEQEEIRQLDESKDKLGKSIEALTKLVDEVPSDVAKSILKEQVESLKKQQEDIEFLVETKEKKAKGWFGLFG